jgi:hypothetical protein
MKSLSTYSFVVFFLLVVGWACKDPFMPNISSSQTNVLVVEGYINVGTAAITTIKLSRTTPVETTALVDVETGAQLSIISNMGEEFFLTEKQPGVYVSQELNLSIEKKYKLAIRTSDAKNYSSEFSTPIITPKIDSVNWKLTSEGIEIYVTTHDSENKTRYYQWEYEETWMTPSVFQSFYYYKAGVLYKRPAEERVLMRRCWKHGESPDVTTASTTSLSQDVIASKLLRFLPMHTEYLDEKYSILVKQHALSKEAFEYLDILKKNSTNVGSFTDPQPSQLFGNITASDSDQIVVGYMQAYTTEQVRIYINASEVPTWKFSLHCDHPYVMNNPDSLTKYFDAMGMIPAEQAGGPDSPDVFASQAPCIDCRLRGGSTTRPDFWPL